MSLIEERIRRNGHGSNEVVIEADIDSGSRQVSRTVARLALLAGALGLISALVGLLWRGSGDAVSATTFLGDEVDLFGRGLYEHDTVFFAANNFATDLVLLVLALPLLGISLRMYMHGSLRGRLLLLGTLGFLLYYGATYALGGVAYNELFLVYVAMFSACLFAFVGTLTSFDGQMVARTFSGDLPRRLAGRFMIGSAVVTLGIWMMDPVASLLSGDPPKGLETHTTLFTHAFDLAVIVPAAFLAGSMILRRESFGYVIAFSLIVLEAFLLPIITVATVVQVRLGVEFTPGEIVGPIVGFGVLAVLSIWVMSSILRNVQATASQAEVVR
jgi:hypothetical protein